MEQDLYQQRIEELRSQLHEVYRQASVAGPEALYPESPFSRQVESLITKITAIHMETRNWPQTALGAFWVPSRRPIPEKSIGATGFEPAT